MNKPETVKMVKIRAKTDIRLEAVEGVRKNEQIIKKDSVVEVTPEEATEFTKELKQHSAFGGTRHGADATLVHTVVRAELVKE